MSSDVLLEEFEVLESIYPTELSKLSERDVQIDVEPDDVLEGEDSLKLSLKVHYTEEYPDVLPELAMECVEGELGDAELTSLEEDLKAVGEENLGMAMTFTIVSHLREKLSEMVIARAEKRRQLEHEKERLILEAEEARTRGTPVTLNSFMAWKAKFDKEIADRRSKSEDERLKGLSAKEREEFKRMGTRLSGRQLFERDTNLATADDSFVEEGTVSVDISQYERSKAAEDDEDENERMQFSDED